MSLSSADTNRTIVERLGGARSDSASHAPARLAGISPTVHNGDPGERSMLRLLPWDDEQPGHNVRTMRGSGHPGCMPRRFPRIGRRFG